MKAEKISSSFSPALYDVAYRDQLIELIRTAKKKTKNSNRIIKADCTVH